MYTIRCFTLFVSVWALALCALAAPGLPADFDPDPEIRSPADFFGFEPGDWHPRHDQIDAYLRYLAEVSDRVELEQIGASHGQRPLTLLSFIAPERRGQLEALRADRVQASRAGEGPAVVWLGYSVHGNEASGATAAVLMAWYLAAARNEEVQGWLDELVILMEPVLNPDGLDRFAHWVNMHRGRHPSADPNDREHHEAWPNGRSNYYWFDLNRDWLPLVHPESRSRMAQLHAWRPHVLTDHHEMGPNSTYFFQPGVPERNNPLTPAGNFELTAAIAEFHARLLDQAGALYYTRESFDDYYLGKGSTYPDLTGGIGILFEQGSSRGHVQDTIYGTRSFADAVANQVLTSISTIQATQALADELIAYQAEFFRSARRAASQARSQAWVLGDGGDPGRAHALVDLLLQHDITVLPVNESVTVDGRRHAPGHAWVIPADQDQYRFLRSVFELVTELDMETFYDVSTWPLAMAYDLPLETVRRLPSVGNALDRAPRFAPAPVRQQALAWLVPWDQRGAAPALAALLAEDFRVQALTRPSRFRLIGGEEIELVRGSLVIHRGVQPAELPAAGARLAELSERFGIQVHAVDGGLAISGLDLGSPSAPVVAAVRPALLVGEGLRSTHAGYIWHWFDQYLEQPLSRLDWQRADSLELNDYTHLILPDGNYRLLPETLAETLATFVRNGGIILAARNASVWVETLPLEWQFRNAGDTESDQAEEAERRDYEAFRLDQARRLIGGSALAVDLDISHPLAFGYLRDELAVFRRGAHRLQAESNAYANVAVYRPEVLASGYLSDFNRERLAGTTALAVSRHGRGAVVRMADDYLFRSYWLGSERLFANALFFSSLVGATQLPSD